MNAEPGPPVLSLFWVTGRLGDGQARFVPWPQM